MFLSSLCFFQNPPAVFIKMFQYVRSEVFFPSFCSTFFFGRGGMIVWKRKNEKCSEGKTAFTHKIITYINKIKKAKVGGFVVVMKLISCAESKLVRKEKSFSPYYRCAFSLTYNHFDLCAAFYDLKWGCTLTHSTDKFPTEHVHVLFSTIYFLLIPPCGKFLIFFGQKLLHQNFHLNFIRWILL